MLMKWSAVMSFAKNATPLRFEAYYEQNAMILV